MGISAAGMGWGEFMREWGRDGDNFVNAGWGWE